MYKYNLILYHAPRRQDISDFLTIRNMMVARARDIEAHVVSDGAIVPASFWKTASARPTLIFSPSAYVKIDAAARGTRMISEPMTKLEELKLAAASGAPVPQTRLITPETRLDEKEWGPFTVVKPNRGLRGRGISLMRTRDVRWIDNSTLPKDDPRHGQELLAQRYVDTGPFLTCNRVFTVLGRPIYCMRSTAVEKRPELDAAGAEAIDLSVAANGVERKLTLSNDRDVIDLAASVHQRAPHLPVMGVDIIREHKTGRLFVLEYNGGGGVWHLSSRHGLRHQHHHGLDYYGQFNALDTITDALIETTHRLAT